MRGPWLCAILWACLAPLCLAQGREFWFAAPEVTSMHGDRPLFLRVTSFDQAAVITISQPANPAFGTITQTLLANTTKSIDLTSKIDFLECKPAGKVLNKGLLITSTRDISAYYEVAGSEFEDTSYINNSDLFVLKGNYALGKLFFIPMQTFWDNQTRNNLDAWSSFDIVATENNTRVIIYPTQAIYPHSTVKTDTIFLNKGQTYSARAFSPLRTLRPAGTKVVSNKPIAITYKDDSIYQNSLGIEGWDLVGDQLVPVSGIGTEYIAINSGIRGGYPDGRPFMFRNDRVFLCAIKNNTKLYIKGDSATTLQAGNTYTYPLLADSAVYITASDSIYAFHVSGFRNELGGALLPPIKCTGVRNVSFIRSNGERFALKIVVKTGGESHFQLNDSTHVLLADSFRTVPNTGGAWKYAQFIFENQSTVQSGKPNILLNSTHDFHLGTVNGGTQSGFRYGYFSGYGSVNLGDERFICQGDSLVLEAGRNKDSYLWNTNATSSSIMVSDSGAYSVKVTKAGCEFNDTVRVKFHPSVSDLILGNDTSACANVPFTIITRQRFTFYKWQDNTTLPVFKPSKSGLYSVSVTDSNGCQKRDSLYFSLLPVPKPEIEYEQNAQNFCEDSTVRLAVKDSYAHYSWPDGQTSQSILTRRNLEDKYEVSVASSDGCVGKTSIQIDCSSFISIPNIFTPNADQINDAFRIKNWKPDLWDLAIFNRWGSQVFASKPYNNDWQAENTPDGVYFYLLKNILTQAEYKGWVQVLR